TPNVGLRRARNTLPPTRRGPAAAAVRARFEPGGQGGDISPFLCVIRFGYTAMPLSTFTPRRSENSMARLTHNRSSVPMSAVRADELPPSIIPAETIKQIGAVVEKLDREQLI